MPCSKYAFQVHLPDRASRSAPQPPPPQPMYSTPDFSSAGNSHAGTRGPRTPVGPARSFSANGTSTGDSPPPALIQMFDGYDYGYLALLREARRRIYDPATWGVSLLSSNYPYRPAAESPQLLHLHRVLMLDIDYAFHGPPLPRYRGTGLVHGPTSRSGKPFSAVSHAKRMYAAIASAYSDCPRRYGSAVSACPPSLATYTSDTTLMHSVRIVLEQWCRAAASRKAHVCDAG